MKVIGKFLYAIFISIMQRNTNFALKIDIYQDF